MEESPFPSGARRWLIIFTVMAAMLMQVLDGTIANVALPHMQATLGASPDSITWVLTSYIVMAAVATPVTGWLEGLVGRRTLFALSIAGFTLSSAACGLATSLGMMVAARALQGLFGALIGPLVQATMLDSSPPAKHPQAMMIFGMGITIGPIIGPVLGGWLTDNFDWRWVFFINVPVGLACLCGVLLLLKPVALPGRRLDIFGVTVLAVTLTAFQLMLDRGTQCDWFDSGEVVIEAIVAAAGFWMFAVHILTAETSVLPRALLRDRNFMISLVFTTVIMGIAISAAALMPAFLQALMGYNAMGAGMMMVPRALGALAAMPLATVLGRHVQARYLVGFGVVLIGTALWLMTGFDLEMGSTRLNETSVVLGLGLGFAFLPLSIMAFSTLAPQLRTEAAAFYSLARNLGGSIMISGSSVLLTRNVQVSHSDLAAHLTMTDLSALSGAMMAELGASGAGMLQFIDREVNRQALMIAYIDNFWVMQWMAFICLPLILLVRRTRATKAPPPVALD